MTIGKHHRLIITLAAKHLTLGLLLVFAASGAVQRQATVQVHWAPTYTINAQNGQTTEGIVFSFEPAATATVVIEGELDGRPLPSASGVPDIHTGFLSAPIRNLDHYKLKRLIITVNGREWTFVYPKQDLQLG